MFNFVCVPIPQTCTAIGRYNDGDNSSTGRTFPDDGYGCPDSLACDTICCTQPQVPPPPPTWKYAGKPKIRVAVLAIAAGDEHTARLRSCCVTLQILRCVLPWRPYQEKYCDEDVTNCYIREAAAASSSERNIFR